MRQPRTRGRDWGEQAMRVTYWISLIRLEGEVAFR
jgi:hypothetical protein